MKLLQIAVIIVAVIALACLWGCHGSGVAVENGGENGGGGDAGDGDGAEFNVPAYAGTWTGQWNNTTVGSSGSVDLDVNVDRDGQTVTFVLDLGGPVLGLVFDPDPVTIDATYDHDSLDVDDAAGIYGDINVEIDDDGNLTGQINPPADNIDRVEVTGTVTETRVEVDYVVYFSDGRIFNGTMELDKQT